MKRLFYITFLLLLSACQEQIEWNLVMENELRLVVDAKLTNELKAHEVYLSLPIYEINGKADPVSGARVVISDGVVNEVLLEDEGRPGVYMTSSDYRGEVGNTYYLYIEVGEYEFLAASKMEPVSEIREPTSYKVQDDPPLYEVYFAGSDTPAKTTLELDWSEVPDYDTLEDSENHAVIYTYDFGSLQVDVNEMFAPARERVHFPPGTKVVISKESMNSGYVN